MKKLNIRWCTIPVLLLTMLGSVSAKIGNEYTLCNHDYNKDKGFIFICGGYGEYVDVPLNSYGYYTAYQACYEKVGSKAITCKDYTKNVDIPYICKYNNACITDTNTDCRKLSDDISIEDNVCLIMAYQGKM